MTVYYCGVPLTADQEFALVWGGGSLTRETPTSPLSVVSYSYRKSYRILALANNPVGCGDLLLLVEIIRRIWKKSPYHQFLVLARANHKNQEKVISMMKRTLPFPVIGVKNYEGAVSSLGSICTIENLIAKTREFNPTHVIYGTGDINRLYDSLYSTCFSGLSLPTIIIQQYGFKEMNDSKDAHMHVLGLGLKEKGIFFHSEILRRCQQTVGRRWADFSSTGIGKVVLPHLESPATTDLGFAYMYQRESLFWYVYALAKMDSNKNLGIILLGPQAGSFIPKDAGGKTQFYCFDTLLDFLRTRFNKICVVNGDKKEIINGNEGTTRSLTLFLRNTMEPSEVIECQIAASVPTGATGDQSANQAIFTGPFCYEELSHKIEWSWNLADYFGKLMPRTVFNSKSGNESSLAKKATITAAELDGLIKEENRAEWFKKAKALASRDCMASIKARLGI